MRPFTNPHPPRTPRRGRLLLAALVAGAGVTACLHHMSPGRTGPGTAPSSGVAWTPPAGTPAVPALSPTPSSGGRSEPGAGSAAAGGSGASIPADLIESARNWGLDDLVDLSLRLSPETRVAWAQARAAAADLGSKRGAYYPTIGVSTDVTRVKGAAVGGRFTFESTSANPYLVLNALLLDFGGRKNAVEETRQALFAADWSHNAAIQDVVLKVEQGYYQYLLARRLQQAEQAAVKEAQASLDAAEHRRASGVSTIADVLQAKTRLSQARLSLETVEGQIMTVRGVLATAVGLPANTPFDVTMPEAEPSLPAISESVEKVIALAQAARPDLAAARARVLQARAHIDKVRAEARPTLSTTFTQGRIYYQADALHQDTYNASLLLRIPIFNGLSHQYDTFKARAEAEAAGAQYESLEQLVIFQVWSSYYNLKTAAQKVETSRDLIDSARQSHEVVSARYQAGVGSILDLLTAESALENARALQAQARTDLLLSLAQLAHDTGTLWRPVTSDTKGTP